MSFPQRFALVLLAAFFLSTVATSLAAALLSPLILRAQRPWTSRDAGALALVRLLPSASALAITALVLGPGYFAHEQRTEPEGSGIALFVLAFCGLWVIAASAIRMALAWRRTVRIRGQWVAAGHRAEIAGAGMPAYVLDLPFPLVAVLGVLRPRLFVSRTVLARCSASELAAILEHERAHVLRRDNAVRMLMDGAPDLLPLTRIPRALATAWHQAVEQRADDAATRRLDLASALVKVAKLAIAAPAVELPASALYRGDGAEQIGTRVRRLVDDAGREPRPRWTAAAGGMAIAIGASLTALAATGTASRAAHAVLEFAVSRLP